jgi:hypothetical protein
MTYDTFKSSSFIIIIFHHTFLKLRQVSIGYDLQRQGMVVRAKISGQFSLKVHKREKFFVADFELFIIL